LIDRVLSSKVWCDILNIVRQWTHLQSDTLIVGSLSGSRLKSVRFLVEESSVDVTSSVDDQIIKIPIN
jgi:hypothetical protein